MYPCVLRLTDSNVIGLSLLEIINIFRFIFYHLFRNQVRFKFKPHLSGLFTLTLTRLAKVDMKSDTRDHCEKIYLF